MSLSWLTNLRDFIANNSFGRASIRVVEYNGATFGIIDPYGYYVVNYKSEIFLMRDKNISIKFAVKEDRVTTSAVNTGKIDIGYIDALFASPPPSSSQMVKFVLFEDSMPRKYTAIQLINRCLDMCIFNI